LCLSDTSQYPVLFPHDEQKLPDGYPRQLFSYSSIMPRPIRYRLLSILAPGQDVPLARGMAFNAEATSFVRTFPDVDDPEYEQAGDAEEATRTAIILQDTGKPSFSPPRCPACDRKAPGPVGCRFCLVCDRSF